ncbi:two-component system regulatory protein YycI [Paenisporosarcina cavernae]|uniref:Regulatory protein YycH-like domain-containing protein n=1 Tax=Paenisporosarcina cavernae TaxID=2320858 RepID=A0A385YP10_9BACL|nr:two-component system regulatory protein YycI [Paenisporosarcina cavernae]AYC28405.1 hypothetical protein D3873_00410 [Paenisporosarcina cavernae]
MDWNKTKTIFIIVFSILNIFLYILYLNRYNDAQGVEPLGEASVSERLKADNIKLLPTTDQTKEESYVSGTVHTFTEEDVESFEDTTFQIVENTKVLAELSKPYAMNDLQSKAQWDAFLDEHVYRGSSYGLWNVDTEARSATFFQHTGGRPLFYNQNATLVVYWNEKKEVIRYDQTAFDDLEKFPETEELITQDRAISTLYSQNKLVPDSAITEVNLGLSTLVQLPETQVFAPTWQVKVELEDGTIHNFFVNAVQGGIIEFEE